MPKGVYERTHVVSKETRAKMSAAATSVEGGTRATRRRAKYLFLDFGITPEIYRALWISQQGECAICGRPERVKGRSLAVDHNHDTGEVRALLCFSCNTGIGFLTDSSVHLRQAALYLDQYKEDTI